MTPQSNNPNRRQFMHRLGATTLGAGAAYYGGSQYAGSPVQNGQAVVPLVAVGLAAGAVTLGWALREYEIVGSDAPAEGLITSQPNNPNRRQFMHRLGATTLGAGAAYYGGSQYAGSPVQNAQAVIPVAIAAAVVGGAAVGYATSYVQDKYLGDDFNETAYDESQADEVHSEIIENGKEKDTTTIRC